MGNNVGVTMAINIDRPNPFYYTDECVSGSVKFDITESKLEVEGVYITLIGAIGYTTTVSVATSGTHVGRQIEYHTAPFYSAKVILAQLEPEQKELVYKQGQYSWPFQFPLTTHLPPTFNQPEKYPHIRYYLEVVIDKPWYKPNNKQGKLLTIFPRVNLLENPRYLVPTIFGNQNRKDIKLNGTLNKSGYVPGELIAVALEIENPQRVCIQRIDLSMLQSYDIRENSNEVNIFKATLPKIVNRKDEQINETISIRIPVVSLPPSYQFQGLQTATYVDIHYLLQFEVKVEGMFTNFEIKVPIILGTKSISDQVHQQTFNPLNNPSSSDVEQSMFSTDTEPPPPSYEFVVQNMNNFTVF
ncbi:unnamed protein product [Adineta steineri]|uniref:Arrestin C-terminal-like domain-containing protein n=1 Tax=Adineta steineri TaxID=433720 RepID=A0A815J8D0_9BILA|nr:unnamed protein product [Adineta steineri]